MLTVIIGTGVVDNFSAANKTMSLPPKSQKAAVDKKKKQPKMEVSPAPPPAVPLTVAKAVKPTEEATALKNMTSTVLNPSKSGMSRTASTGKSGSGTGEIVSNAERASCVASTQNPEKSSANYESTMSSAINTPAFSYGFDASPYSDLGIWESSPRTWRSQTPTTSLVQGSQYVQPAMMASEEAQFYTSSVQDEPYQVTEMSSPLITFGDQTHVYEGPPVIRMPPPGNLADTFKQQSTQKVPKDEPSASLPAYDQESLLERLRRMQTEDAPRVLTPTVVNMVQGSSGQAAPPGIPAANLRGESITVDTGDSSVQQVPPHLSHLFHSFHDFSFTYHPSTSHAPRAFYSHPFPHLLHALGDRAPESGVEPEWLSRVESVRACGRDHEYSWCCMEKDCMEGGLF